MHSALQFRAGHKIPATIYGSGFWGGSSVFSLFSRFGSKLRFFLCDCLHATIYGSGFSGMALRICFFPAYYFSPVFYTMVSLFNAEPVRALIDTEVGVSTIALSLARRWWPEVRLGECMQGVLATQFEGVFYSVHCDFIVVLQNERLGGDNVEVVAGNNWVGFCRVMLSDSRSGRVVGEFL
jgi:hypothetical protein